MKLFTVGCAGIDPESLLQLLLDAGVRTVVDVRWQAQPPSPGATSCDPGMEQLLSSRGITYRTVPGLGNIFLECDDWRERYASVLRRVGDLLVSKLQGLEGPLCLLGAEGRALDCHRSEIADYLASKGHKIEHLDAAACPDGGRS